MKFEFDKDLNECTITRRRGWPWRRYTEYAIVLLHVSTWYYQFAHGPFRAVEYPLWCKLNSARAAKKLELEELARAQNSPWIRVAPPPRAKALQAKEIYGIKG